jgi:uncharacterized membrane protein
MKLPTFDKQEEIPKGFEEAYEEEDGKWVPIDEAGTLKQALDDERQARKNAEAVAKKAAREAADAATKREASAKGMTEEELKKIYDSVEANVRAEYEPKLADMDKIVTENRALKLDNRVKGLFKKHGALDAKLDDFWKLHGEEFDLTSDDKPMVRAEPGKDVERHVQGILKSRKEWTLGTKGGGSGTGFNGTTPTTGQNATGLSFEDVVKNPALAIAAANEG